jgi:hypothetical protein
MKRLICDRCQLITRQGSGDKSLVGIAAALFAGTPLVSLEEDDMQLQNVTWPGTRSSRGKPTLLDPRAMDPGRDDASDEQRFPLLPRRFPRVPQE